MSSAVTPLCLSPTPVQRPWGGNRAAIVADLPAPEASTPVGEWWLLSTRPDAPSRVAGGDHAGRSLQEVLGELPHAWLGRRWQSWLDRFPLLVKLLDTADRLSVQLHPSDEDRPGQGKSESWLILDAGPDASAYLGLNGTGRAEFFASAAAGQGTAAQLGRHPLAAGDVVHVPAGMIHALAGPVVALEVQQNSDTTYRIHDWNREPPRELHLEQARRAARADQRPVLPRPRVLQEDPFRRESLVHCPEYSMERLALSGAVELATDGRSFQVLIPFGTPVELHGKSGMLHVPRGHACLIPARAAGYHVVPTEPEHTAVPEEPSSPFLIRLLPPPSRD